MQLDRRGLLTLFLSARAVYGAAGTRPWTILALGDSITEGSNRFSTYREPLARLLSENGFDVRFLGSRYRKGEAESLRHEGYSGRNAEFLAENFERIYTANRADIILLHSGHNHFAEEHPINGILAATEQIVQSARRINPSVAVLLAQVIPSGKLPKYSYIPELNRALAGLAARLDSSVQRVILVDQASEFRIGTDTIQDLVHPNAAGAEKMAMQWYAKLAPVLSGPPPVQDGPRS